MKQTEKIIIPDLGEDVDEVRVTEWLRNSGDTVIKDDELVEISTDKAVFSISSPFSGILDKQMCREGDTIIVGSVIATIKTDHFSCKEVSDE